MKRFMEVVIEKMEETQMIRLLLVLAADISLLVAIFTSYDKIFLPASFLFMILANGDKILDKFQGRKAKKYLEQN